MAIDGTTRLYGLIGDPVAHSLSPALHNAAFAAHGINAAYVAFRVTSDSVSAAVAGLAALGLQGVNVTVPHKTAVIPNLTSLSDDARAVAAVNTIVCDEAGLHGHNTDVSGAQQALSAAVGQQLAGRPLLLLGAGGAARAVALAAARLGAAITVVSRRPEPAADLCQRIRGAAPAAQIAALPWGDLSAAAIAAHPTIVNATTLGMTASDKVPAVVVDNLSRVHVVFDVVYSHEETELLMHARSRGATVVDGREMLLAQAAAAFTLWVKQPAPLDAMRRALAN